MDIDKNVKKYNDENGRNYLKKRHYGLLKIMQYESSKFFNTLI